LNELKEILSQLRLSFGTSPPNWPPRSLEDLSRTTSPLMRTIDDLALSIRSLNALRNSDILYLGELVRKSEADLLWTSTCGRKSVNEIKEALSEIGMSLGAELPRWELDAAFEDHGGPETL
jgi:DNA-directed RNA polymerase alpha subunit